MATTYDGVEIQYLTEEEGRALFDRVARECLGMSGEEFLRRWDAGEFAGDDRDEVIHLFMLMPFAGHPSS